MRDFLTSFINSKSDSLFVINLQAKGSLILVLRVTPQLFLEGARKFMRQLSKVLEIVAFIRMKDGSQMIYPFDLSTLGRARREVHRVAHVIVRRASEG